MYEDEVVVDDVLVRELVATQFPRWASLPLERVASSGNVNALYRLGPDLVVRLPRVPLGELDLAREVEWLPRLAPSLPVQVPTPVANGRPSARYPLSWAVYSWIDGEVSSDAEPFDRAERVARDLADVIGALRRIRLGGPPGFRGHDLGVRDDEVRAAMAVIDGEIDAEALTHAWNAALRAPRWTKTPVWTHGDLLPANVVLREGRLAGLIDFGCAGVGDPACDLMPAWTMFAGDSREVFRRAVDPGNAAWARGRGWALCIGVVGCAYFTESNPSFAALARRIVDEVLADD